MPMFHTAGLNLFANPVFHAGGTVIVMRSFDPQAMLDALTDDSLGISHTFAVPAAYQFIAQLPAFQQACFPTLKIACVGGAATPETVLRTWSDKGIAMPNGYGMTETSPAVSLLLPRDAARKTGSVGRPLLHTEIRVVTADGRDAAPDEPGELYVRGPNVTPGYWNNPAASADAFDQGWLKTGDIIRRDTEGFCYVLDRAKDMYISGGENVYPAEIENVLSALQGVAEAAVVGLPHERWGEVGLAVIALQPGAKVDSADVLAHCASRLARFKHPHRIEFVDALPRTASGKIHKPSLRQRFVPD
jgi:fatty-acyl-CoA synthase